MWIPTAMIAAAAGAGLMAAVMAYLAAVERDNLVWRLWSISFALDAARTLVLAFASPHGTVTVCGITTHDGVCASQPPAMKLV